jgi:hypothetical protein
MLTPVRSLDRVTGPFSPSTPSPFGHRARPPGGARGERVDRAVPPAVKALDVAEPTSRSLSLKNVLQA